MIEEAVTLNSWTKLKHAQGIVCMYVFVCMYVCKYACTVYQCLSPKTVLFLFAL